MSNNPVSIRLDDDDLKAIVTLLERYPFLKSRVAAISFALAIATQATARVPDAEAETETT